MYVQDMILKLMRYWGSHGCILGQSYDVEKGAGTMSPLTFFRCLGPEPWRVAYVEPSRRPVDARYGKNPNRTYQHLQYQVVLKPAPADVVDLYLSSLTHLGLDPAGHDIRLVEDNWEAPTLGAWGLGWEVWLDGTEITQFTYFQQMGGLDLDPISAELTYGIERLACYLQDVDSIYALEWARGISYGELFGQNEYEQSVFALDHVDPAAMAQLFAAYEGQAEAALEAGLIIPAYEWILKCSHAFNTLEARGAVGVAERTTYIGRIRALARRAAAAYLESRGAAGYPLLAAAPGGGGL